MRYICGVCHLVLVIWPNLDFFQQALEWVAQKGCHVSIIGGTWDLGRASPVQPFLTGPVGGWTEHLQGPSQPQPSYGFMMKHPPEDTTHFLVTLLAPGHSGLDWDRLCSNIWSFPLTHSLPGRDTGSTLSHPLVFSWHVKVLSAVILLPNPWWVEIILQSVWGRQKSTTWLLWLWVVRLHDMSDPFCPRPPVPSPFFMWHLYKADCYRLTAAFLK